MSLFGDCRPTGQDLTKGSRQVIETIMNNGAFENPVNTKTTTDILALIPIGDGDPAEPFGARLAVISQALGEFNTHTKKLSGTGDITEFSKIIGISQSFNDSKATMENSKQDNFSQMFQSVVKGPEKLSELEALSSAIQTAAINDDPNLGNLVTEAEQLKANIDSMRENDNANFNEAFAYVIKKGLGQSISSMVSPDGNCFAKKLIEEQLATSDLRGAIATFGLPNNIQNNLPDSSTIDINGIETGVGETENTARAAAQDREIRLKAVEADNILLKSEIGITTKTTEESRVDSIDGGSYGT